MDMNRQDEFDRKKAQIDDLFLFLSLFTIYREIAEDAGSGCLAATLQVT